MLIYKDLFTGDEVVSDSYPMQVLDDMILQFESNFINVNNTIDESKIGGNASAEEVEEGAEDQERTELNIVESHKLVETGYNTKKEFLLTFKSYIKNLMKKLEETDPERLAVFMTKIEKVLKERILPVYNELRFFDSETGCGQGMPILAYYPDGAATPYFWFLKDGLVEEKC